MGNLTIIHITAIRGKHACFSQPIPNQWELTVKCGMNQRIREIDTVSVTVSGSVTGMMLCL